MSRVGPATAWLRSICALQMVASGETPRAAALAFEVSRDFSFPASFLFCLTSRVYSLSQFGIALATILKTTSMPHLAPLYYVIRYYLPFPSLSLSAINALTWPCKSCQCYSRITPSKLPIFSKYANRNYANLKCRIIVLWCIQYYLTRSSVEGFTVAREKTCGSPPVMLWVAVNIVYPGWWCCFGAFQSGYEGNSSPRDPPTNMEGNYCAKLGSRGRIAQIAYTLALLQKYKLEGA